MPVVDGLPRSVVRGHVTPRQPASSPPEHSVDHRAVIGPSTTPLRGLIGQQRLQPSPFLIGQIVTIEHADGLPHPPVKIHGTRSSGVCLCDRPRWAQRLALRVRQVHPASLNHRVLVANPEFLSCANSPPPCPSRSPLSGTPRSTGAPGRCRTEVGLRACAPARPGCAREWWRRIRISGHCPPRGGERRGGRLPAPRQDRRYRSGQARSAGPVPCQYSQSGPRPGD